MWIDFSQPLHIDELQPETDFQKKVGEFLLMDYFNYSVSEIISEKEYKEQIKNNG